MKHLSKYLVGLMLMAMGSVTAQAQEAFYIYQNDGRFDGFFYDEVEKIRYSKLDTLGFEHESVVSQEVVTADSTYRFMLTAIDSIGFHQPEIRFNPKFRNLDALGVSQYLKILSRENMIFAFPDDFPYWDIYTPEVGDVIASFTKDFYGEEGFCGKVTSVDDLYYDSDGNRQFRVRLAKVEDLGDIFDQFITTEQIYADEEGNIHRRIAGCDEEGRPILTRGQKDDIGGTLISFNTNIQREYTPKDGVNISLGTDLSFNLGLRVSYNITWRRIYVKIEMPAEFKLTPKIGAKLSKSFEWYVGDLPKFLKAIKFPPQCPILQTLPLPEFVIRGGGELAATLSLPSVGFDIKPSIVIDTDMPNLADFNWTKNESGEEATPDAVDYGSAEINLAGYVQTALKLSANIETCDWFSDLLFCRIALDLYVGPKFEGNLKLSSEMFNDGQEWFDTPYKILQSSGFKITPLSCDLEAKGTLGWLFKDKEERTFLSTNLSFFPTELFAIPKINKISAEAFPGYPTGKIVYKAKTEGRPIIPTNIGAKIISAHRFDWEEVTEAEMKPKYAGYHTFTDKEKESLVNFPSLSPGRYYIEPIMQTFGIEYRGVTNDTYCDVYLWPRFFNKARVTITGMEHTKKHEWGKKEDGTTYDTEKEEDLESSHYCDVEVDCDESDGHYTITANISEPSEYTSGDISDPNCLNHDKYLTTHKLTLHLKTIEGMLYVTDGEYEYGYETHSTSTYHGVYHGEYRDIDGEMRPFTRTEDKNAKDDQVFKRTFSFSNLMIPFKDDWAGDLVFEIKDVEATGSSTYTRDGYYSESSVCTAPDTKDIRKSSEHHERNTDEFKAGQPMNISVILTF